MHTPHWKGTQAEATNETATCLQQYQKRQQLVPGSGQTPRNQDSKDCCRKQLSNEQISIFKAATYLQFKYIYGHILGSSAHVFMEDGRLFSFSQGYSVWSQVSRALLINERLD